MILLSSRRAANLHAAERRRMFIRRDIKSRRIGGATAHGLLWLDRVLCKDDGSYRTCAQNYEKGIYDENTGQELDPERKPKPNGRLIRIVIAKSKRTVERRRL
jgi:hypothetical protein